MVFWLLQPLRRWLIGWALIGMALTAVIYGCVGLTGVLGYVYLGVNLLDVESASEAWQMLPWIIASRRRDRRRAAGLFFWWKERA